MGLSRWSPNQRMLETEQQLINRSFEAVKEGLHVISQPQGVSTYKNYEDASFVVGDSPVTLAVETDLGRKSQDGSIACDGAGSILVSVNGGDSVTIKKDEVLSLTNFEVSTIVITHSGTDSAYRVFVC